MSSVLGLGERAGIVDLAGLLSNLSETFEKSPYWKLDLLKELANIVDNKDLVSEILKEIKRIARRETPIDIEEELSAVVERCL